MYDKIIEPLLAILLAPLILPLAAFWWWRDRVKQQRRPTGE
jgi:hypothetical protein